MWSCENTGHVTKRSRFSDDRVDGRSGRTSIAKSTWPQASGRRISIARLSFEEEWICADWAPEDPFEERDGR
jgi:hypothetical protein